MALEQRPDVAYLSAHSKYLTLAEGMEEQPLSGTVIDTALSQLEEAIEEQPPSVIGQIMSTLVKYFKIHPETAVLHKEKTAQAP